MSKDKSMFEAIQSSNSITGSGRCPSCGSNNIQVDTSKVLTSMPPKYNCRCLSCGNHFYSNEIHYDWTKSDSLDWYKPYTTAPYQPSIVDPIQPSIVDPLQPSIVDPLPNTPYLGGNMGWVCPKCGRVLAPHMNYCDCSSKSNITVGTSTDTTIAPCDPFKYITQSISYEGEYNNQLKATDNLANKIDKEAMRKKFLDESDSVFEAVSKYNEWEAQQK